MRRLEASLPVGRVLLGVDLALAVWTVVWVAIGLAVSREVEGLTELSGTVRTVGAAVETSGALLASLAELPIVGTLGGTLAAPAGEIQEAGRSARAGGESARQSIDTLSVLLGLAIALIPSVPLIAIYLPARVSRVREARAIDSARRLAGDDPLFREFLARRAAQNLSYRRLSELAPEPWRELAAGRFDRLARAELERLGVYAGPSGEPK